MKQWISKSLTIPSRCSASNRGNARHTIADWVNGALIFKNRSQLLRAAVSDRARRRGRCDCDRGVFLAGNWGSGTLSPLPDPCAAVIVRKKLPPRRQEKITFVLGFAADTGQEDTVKTVFRIINSAGGAPPISADFPKIRTPDPLLNAMASHWLPWQTLICRIHARTGFYQCSGAWGFRDQLQDSISALGLTRRLPAGRF